MGDGTDIRSQHGALLMIREAGRRERPTAPTGHRHVAYGVGEAHPVEWQDAGGAARRRDVDDTLADVGDGVLRVGITENPPWTEVADDGSVGGAEVRLVEQLAGRLHARIEWYPGSESSLMAALHGRVLDLVVGGLDAAAPWLKEAALTRPYVTLRTVIGAPEG